MSSSASRIRPRERDGECLSVNLIDKETAKKSNIGPITPEISSFLNPMDLQTFLRDHYEKRRALAIKVHPSLRETRLEFVKTLLHNFNPRLMLENSNSVGDGISVWMKLLKGENELRSMKTTPENAMNCYQAGNSLYFRGTEDIESAFIPSFMQQLGFSFGSYFRDGARRGECEVFAAHPGHVTTWHTDFQENFTIQLMGQKKWYLRKADVDFPFRACATHFTDPAAAKVLRTQHAIQHLDTTSNGKQFNMVPEDIEETCETVVLQPGDVLYHPAGVWHKVETLPAEQNSLSINFSLFPLQWGEMMQEAMQTMMLRMTHWRRPVMIMNNNNDPQQGRDFARKMALAMVQSLKSELDHLSGEHLLPPAILDSATKTLPKFIKFNDEGEIVHISPQCDKIKGVSSAAEKKKKIEAIIKKFVSGFPKIGTTTTGNDDDDTNDDNENIAFSRNPLSVIVEVNKKLLELMPSTNDTNNDEEDDDEEDEEDEEDMESLDELDDDEDAEDDLELDEDDSDEDDDEEGEETENKTTTTTFDLWNNFVSDEGNFGAPALRMTIQVPTKSLRKVFIGIANSRAEKPLPLKVFPSLTENENCNVLGFLCYVGFFTVVASK